MKIWKFSTISVIITLFCSFPAFAGTWNHDPKGWWFQRQNGSYPSDTWQEIDEKWYFFNQDGYMQTGWVQCEENWYYCNLNGSLATDQWIGEMYYVGSDGAMYVNTTTPDGREVDETGKLVAEKDYSMYIGEFTDLEDYANEAMYYSLGEIHSLTITDIRDNKVYGNATYGYTRLYDENFEDGVEIQGDSFTTNGVFSDNSGVFSGDFSEPEGVPFTSKYTFSQKNGRAVLVKEDGLLLYKRND